jgi:hypothetical protein
MDLAALQQGHLIGPAPRSISCARWGSVFGIARQEFRQDAFRWFVAEPPKGPVSRQFGRKRVVSSANSLAEPLSTVSKRS